jgi:hypothetical protein
MCHVFFSFFFSYKTNHSANLLSFEFILLDGECHVKQLRLFLQVDGLQPRRNTCARIAACVHDMLVIMMLRLIKECLDARLGEGPGTGIQGFFLAPDNCLGVGVHVQILFELLPWEGVQLFDTSECCVSDFIVGSVFVKCSVDLTRAEDDTLNALRLVNRLAVLYFRNDPTEVAFTSKFFNA